MPENKLTDAEIKAKFDAAFTEGPYPGEVYEHHRGGLYVVVACSLDEGTLEPLVTYRQNRTGVVFTRPLQSFRARLIGVGRSPGMLRFMRNLL